MGERVPELAKEYGIVPKTIYNLLRKTLHGTGALLELSKLKRENQALLQIIGQLTAQAHMGGNAAHSFIWQRLKIFLPDK